jgi:hypothetical protein
LRNLIDILVTDDNVLTGAPSLEIQDNQLLVDYIIEQMPLKTIHITFFNDLSSKIHNLHQIWKKYPGDINHLSEHGNAEVAKYIRKLL